MGRDALEYEVKIEVEQPSTLKEDMEALFNKGEQWEESNELHTNPSTK